MSKAQPLHSSYEWQKLRKRRMAIAKANQEPCAMCSAPIDYTLHGNHQHGPTIDHAMPVSMGGEGLPPLEQLRPAHRSCNARQGQRVKTAKERSRKTRKENRDESTIETTGVNLSGPLPHPARSEKTLPETSWKARISPEAEPLLNGHSGGMPRFFTPSHPRAVSSLYTQAEEDWLIAEMGVTPRSWQRAVLTRALEVDEDGHLVHRVVIVSVGRQSGKTWLIRMLTSLRQRLFGHEETQQMLHLARVRDAARSVIVNEVFARWARGRGIVVRSSNGQEQWLWPDDSTWDLSSLSGAYGRTANLVLCDETWDITRNQYFEGVQPTMAARMNAQVWFFSAAHREASDLTPLMISRARDGRDGYALFDWGALDDEDLSDPRTWESMGPHWDSNRRLIVSDAMGEEAFETQWGNRWPPLLSSAAKSPFPAWGALGQVDSKP